MNKSGNQIYQTTEARLEAAYLRLIRQQKGAVTVSALCRASGISRPTFYSHYEDISELTEALERRKSEVVKDILVQNRSLTERDFQAYLSYIKENRDFYRAYFSQPHPESLSGEMRQNYRELHYSAASEESALHYALFTAGLKGLVRSWLEQGCPDPLSKPAQILYDHYRLLP